LLQISTPHWWWIIVVPFIFGLARAKTGMYAFLLTATVAVSVWLTGSIFDYLTGSGIIAHRVAAMMTSNSVVLLFLLTLIVAAFPAGVAGLTGYTLRDSIKRR
jgi:hypothetical protein